MVNKKRKRAVFTNNIFKSFPSIINISLIRTNEIGKINNTNNKDSWPSYLNHIYIIIKNGDNINTLYWILEKVGPNITAYVFFPDILSDSISLKLLTINIAAEIIPVITPNKKDNSFILCVWI